MMSALEFAALTMATAVLLMDGVILLWLLRRVSALERQNRAMSMSDYQARSKDRSGRL